MSFRCIPLARRHQGLDIPWLELAERYFPERLIARGYTPRKTAKLRTDAAKAQTSIILAMLMVGRAPESEGNAERDADGDGQTRCLRYERYRGVPSPNCASRSMPRISTCVFFLQISNRGLDYALE
jgi:hypothetical protein